MIEQKDENLGNWGVEIWNHLAWICKGVSVNVTDYGAVGNSLIDDSQAFAKAWRASCLATQADQAKIVMPAAKTFMLQPTNFKLRTC
ncbi:hypothetical protein ABKV19_022612 [Rosa sericea]